VATRHRQRLTENTVLPPLQLKCGGTWLGQRGCRGEPARVSKDDQLQSARIVLGSACRAPLHITVHLGSGVKRCRRISWVAQAVSMPSTDLINQPSL